MIRRQFLSRPRAVARVLVIAVAATALAGCAARGDEGARLNQDGNDRYAAGDYQGASDDYLRAGLERPDLTAIDYNEGNTLHRLGQFDRAIEASRRAAAEGTNDVRARAYYAIGNHYARLDRWREAYESYRNALILAPTDPATKHNLEVALRRLAPDNNSPQAAQQPGAQPGQGQGQGDQQGNAQPGGQQPGQQGGQPGQGQGQQPGQQGGQGQPDPNASQGQGGNGQQPGQAPGQPGGQQAGQPGAGGQPGAPGGAQAGAAGGAGDLQGSLAQFERSGSAEDAFRILNILAEQQRQRQQAAPAPPPGSNIRDQ